MQWMFWIKSCYHSHSRYESATEAEYQAATDTLTALLLKSTTSWGDKDSAARGRQRQVILLVLLFSAHATLIYCY